MKKNIETKERKIAKNLMDSMHSPMDDLTLKGILLMMIILWLIVGLIAGVTTGSIGIMGGCITGIILGFVGFVSGLILGLIMWAVVKLFISGYSK